MDFATGTKMTLSIKPSTGKSRDQERPQIPAYKHKYVSKKNLTMHKN